MRVLFPLLRSPHLQFPVYIRIGNLSLDPHLVFEALAYFIGFRIYQILRYRQGDAVTRHNRWSIIAAAALGGAIGSKVLYWLEDPTQTFHRWRDVSYLMGGKTIVGGLVGGLIAVEITKRVMGEKQRSGDLFAAPLAFGIAIGRIGCFLEGLPDQTYGTPSSLPWAINLGDGVPRHPVQLYEFVFTLMLGIYLLRFQSTEHESGDTFKIFMVTYLAFRLLIDFIKPGVPLLGLTSIQWTCLLTLFYYAPDIRRWSASRTRLETA